MKTTSETLIELEERLAGPDGQAVRQQLQSDLAELELRLASRLAAMVPRNEFPALTASLEACRAAQLVARK
jgi:hypothetical protein